MTTNTSTTRKSTVKVFLYALVCAAIEVGLRAVVAAWVQRQIAALIARDEVTDVIEHDRVAVQNHLAAVGE